jgi:DivIVA domain-containing protein
MRSPVRSKGAPVTAIDDGPNVAPSRPHLSPERVRTREFSRTQIGRRGYAEEEVRLFLERVAEDIAARDAEDASMRAMVLHFQSRLAEQRGDDRTPATTAVLSVEAVNILSRAQHEADATVARAQAYSRQLAADARQHADQILERAQAQADHAADAAVHGYRARAGDAYTPQFEELARRLTWARTFVTSLESVEVQLRTAREALAYEFDRLGDAGPAPGP